MKPYRIEYFVPMAGYPGGGFSRSKRVMAADAEQARMIMQATITNKGSSIRIVKIYEDNCKNCHKKRK